MIIKFHVAGIPAPQGSKRPVRLGSGKVGMVESSKKVGPWRDAVRGEAQRELAAAGQAPRSGPVRVVLEFTLPRPVAHYGRGAHAAQLRAGAPGYPAGAPDLDKLARSTLDGLTMGGAVRDDAQVTDLVAYKRYAERGAAPGCTITITEL